MGAAVLSFVVVTHHLSYKFWETCTSLSSPFLLNCLETLYPVGFPYRADGCVLEHGDECCLQNWLRDYLLICELTYRCLMGHPVL